MRVTEPYTIFKRVLPSGKVVYYYQFRYSDGRRSAARSTGCTNLTKAKRFCQKLYNENGFEDGKENEVVTFGQFSKDFFAEDGDFRKWKRTNGYDLKEETIRRYRLALERHVMPFFKDVDIKKITKDMCKKWVVWASERLSPKSVNSAQGVLNLVMESAIDKEFVSVNPLRRIGMRKVEKKKKELLTIEELSMLYKGHWANNVEREAFLLASVTGMRIGEVCALKREDIKDGYLDVTKSYSDKCGIQNTTKTGVCRCVPYPKDFDFSFVESGYVFSVDNGKNPIKPHCVYNAFTRNMDAIGISRKERGITLHSLRNLFVSYMRSQNISDPKIRAVVGHADETMTDLYTYWKPDMFPEVYEAQNCLYEAIVKEN